MNQHNIEAIQGDPERTICLVVTPDWLLSNEAARNVRTSVECALFGSKWTGIPVLVRPPGWTLQAVELTKEQMAAMRQDGPKCSYCDAPSTGGYFGEAGRVNCCAAHGEQATKDFAEAVKSHLKQEA